MVLFEEIYKSANKQRFIEMSARKAKNIIDAASFRHSNNERNADTNETLTTRVDIENFIELYKKGEEYYYHNTEKGERLNDIEDFIKEFYDIARKTNDLAHYKIQFLNMVKLLPRNLFCR